MAATDLILGFMIAAVVGISLGLTGGGGSILTIPAMVYVLHIEPLLATSYSLFIVAFASLAGSVNNMYRGLVNYRAAAIYALPSMISVFITRKFLLPLIPKEIVLGRILLNKGETLMLLLAFIMLIASFSMLRSGERDRPVQSDSGTTYNYPLIFVEGIIVGAVTGVLGAGGGFLIIPVLVIVSHIPMRIAIGTSLLIISVNAMVGFAGDVDHHEIEWLFLIPFTIVAVVFVTIGSYAGRNLSSARLRKVFGWFVFGIACFILYSEIVLRKG